MPSVLHEDNFSQSTIIELLEQYWHVTYIYKNDPDLIYYFYLPNYKKWCLEYLQKKWLKSLPSLKLVLKKIEQQDANCNPYLYHDNEQYYETLVKFKEIITKPEKRRKKYIFKKIILKTIKKVLKVVIFCTYFFRILSVTNLF